MATTEELQAQTEQSLTEAIESLTVGEVRVIERHFGNSLDSGKLSGTDLTVAVIWALERRAWQARDTTRTGGPEGRKPDWSDYDSWSMKRVNAYFSPEAVEVSPAEPETAEGKDDTPDE